MIKGTYIFYQDGVEINRSSNIITKFGKRFLTNLLAGRVSFDNKSLSFGIDPTSATQNDTRLGFEFYKVPVSFGSTDIATVDGETSYAVVYKTTIPQDVSGEIYEVGLYPNSLPTLNNYDSRFLAGFDSQIDWYDSTNSSPEFTALHSRVGQNVLDMVSGVGTEKEFKTNINTLDLSGYSTNDTIRFSFYQYDSSLDYITIKLYSSPSDYYSEEVPAVSVGYQISEDIFMSEFLNNPTGSPSASNITKIGISVHPLSSQQSTIGADGLRINDEDTFNPDFGIISRSVLGTRISKVAGRQVDVEYRLDMAF